MKNFTSLIIILLLHLPAFANADYPELRKKIQQKQEEFNPVLKYGQLLLQTNTLSLNKRDLQSVLKNAAATMKLDSIVTDTIGQAGTWQHEWKEVFLYDAEMKNTVLESKEWNTGTDSWFTYDRMEMEYDSQGRISSLLIYARDEPGEELSLMSKADAAYDASGRLESIMYYTPGEGAEWVLEMKQLYSYDASDKITETNVWAREEGEMIKTMRTEHAYNTSGNIELIKTYYLIEGMEILFSETNMSYNASGQLIVEEDRTLNYTSFALEKDSRITTTYNAAGDISSETYASWDADSQTWIDEETDEFTYGSTSFSDVVYPAYYFLYVTVEESSSYDLSKIITEINTSEWTGDSWENREKSSYYYSSTNPSEVDLVEKANFWVFPNPASEYVKFNWADESKDLSLKIFRIDGSKVLEQTARSGKAIPVSRLKRGVYFFRLMDGEKTVHAGKLVRK